MQTSKFTIEVVSTHTDQDGRFFITETHPGGYNIIEHDPFTTQHVYLVGVAQLEYPQPSTHGRNEAFSMLRSLGFSLDEIHSCKDSRMHEPCQMMALNPSPTPGGDHVPKYDEDIKVVIIKWND